MSWSVKVFKDDFFTDKRGNIWTSWLKDKKKYNNLKFKHDKFAISKKNVLRGFHWDVKTWKLISCVYGKIFLAIICLKKKDKDYLKCKSYMLDPKKKNIQVLIPPYYANATLCLSNECVLHYKLAYSGKYNDVLKQKSLKWNDFKIKIKWPKTKKLILSKRDK